MPCSISMKRNDPSVQWGFRLQGGTDFRIPLSIKKVSSDSPAGISGLSEGDLVLEINGIPSTQITHHQGIEMIKRAGLELKIVAEKHKMSIIKPTLQPQKFVAPVGSELVLDATMEGACNVTLGGAQVAGQPSAPARLSMLTTQQQPTQQPPTQRPTQQQPAKFATVHAPAPATIRAPVQAPVKAPTHAPVKAPVQSSVHVPIQAPIQSPVYAPVHTSVNAPVNAPVYAPSQAPIHAQIQAPVHAPRSVMPPVPRRVLGTNALGKPIYEGGPLDLRAPKPYLA